jgi:hypothetical protein
MWREHGSAALIFVVASVAMTWPLALNLDRAVADPGDPYIVIWILDWNWWATFHSPGSLFHANIFHPAKYSLAFSEHLYGLALLLFPLRAAGVDPITTYNIALLAGFAFCGFAAYLLGRHLTGSWVAGIAAGVFYAFVPFRFVHLSHLQHIWGGWLPFLLLALLLYAANPTPRRAAAFGAAFVMNGLTNVHYLFFGAFAVGITALLLVPRREWRNLALAMFVALLILAPFLYPYAVVAKLYDMQRTWEEVYRFSALPHDWLPGAEEPERRLFPGAVALLIAGAGALLAGPLARRMFPGSASRARGGLALAALWIVIGFLGSLGLNFELHRFLFGAVPGFRAIRAPTRWAVIAYIGLAILIALATAVVAKRNRWLAALLPVALIASLWMAPIRWYLTDPAIPPLYRWLATQEVRAIAELPIDLAGLEYEYLRMTTAHRQRTVNGISGFSPRFRDELSASWKRDPIPDAFLDMLEAAGVELVIVHADAMGERAVQVREWVARETRRNRLSFVRRFDRRLGHDWVFSIGRSGEGDRGELQAFLDGDAICGSSTAGVLDFPPPGMDFKTGNATFTGWVTAPAGVASVDLWFNNRTVRARAALRPDPKFRRRCLDLPEAEHVRFAAAFEDRPPGLWEQNDVQVEITDGNGDRSVLDGRWFRWRKRPFYLR